MKERFTDKIRRMFHWVMDRIKFLSTLDPAAFRGAVVAVASVLTMIGVRVTPGVPDVVVTVLTAVVTVSSIISAMWTRRAVTPNNQVVVVAPYPTEFPTHVVPGPAITTANDARIVEAARSTPRE